MPLQTHLCSELWQSLTMCSPVLTRPSSCRSFWSDKEPSSSLYAILLVWTSSRCQGLLQIVHHKPYRLLKLLPIPKKPWNSISMDFIEKLPPSSGHTSLLVIVDCLSKQSLFIPTHDTITSPQLAQLFILHVFSKHSIPSHVISDRGMEFVSHFFLFTWNGTRYEAAFHFGISSQRRRTDRMNESDFGTVSPSLL